nr:hypothetical protein HK105_003568 [Polyrhizophydium stewartii]
MSGAINQLRIPTKEVDLAAQSTVIADRIKFVCLHGQGSNPAHMKYQLSAVAASFGDRAEWVYVQAPLDAESSDLAEPFGDDLDWFEWFSTQKTTAVSIDRAVNYIIKKLAPMGPIHCLVGFSQGATMVELLDRLSLHGRVRKTWQLSVLFSGTHLMAPGLPAHLTQAHPGGIPARSVHVNSIGDDYASHHGLKSFYRNSSSIELHHNAGIDIPRDVKFGSDLFKAIVSLLEAPEESMHVETLGSFLSKFSVSTGNRSEALPL